jgi:hypothetical protein
MLGKENPTGPRILGLCSSLPPLDPSKEILLMTNRIDLKIHKNYEKKI